MPDDLYPSEVNPVLFTDAFKLHEGASGTYRLANRRPPEGEKPEVTAQRKAILTIAAQLQVMDRDRLLDEFCRDWLRFRNLPVPGKEDVKKSGVDLQRPSAPDESVQGAVRTDTLGSEPTHNSSAHGSAQPAGGITVP